ncbi:MAG: hypothetical protein HC860_12865 [Alkalinema sp. RU_4_3]|nr:hypothetical protein [Alkalinema sp. RU_4_3]
MDLERAIDYTNRLLLGSRQRSLTAIEALTFKAIWLDLSYQDASQNSNYEVATIKNAASRLLQDLSKAVDQRVSKKNCKGIVLALASQVETQVDWGNAPIDMQPFCGRTVELAQLQQWILGDRAKLISLLGTGGIGKTALAARAGDHVSADFAFVLWRSLREAPPLRELLTDLVQFLSGFTEIELPPMDDRAISRLLHYLQQQRCLIIFDNAEAIMAAGDYAGQYRPGYENYGLLFGAIGTVRHQSCLLLTSREPLPELMELAGVDLPVRSISLTGLDHAANQLLEKIGLQGVPSDLDRLRDHCQGNPLYLRIVANTIVQTFNGKVAQFLQGDQYTYGKIAAVLQQQLDRLTIPEKVIVYHLAIKREPQTRSQLEQHLQPLDLVRDLDQTINSLQSRSLLETTQNEGFTLQNVVMEFMTTSVLQVLSAEIRGDRAAFFLTA